MNSILDQINSLLYPYVLGWWSENNGASFVVTNTVCTQLRGFGERVWYPFSPLPYNKHNLRLEVVTPFLFGDDYLETLLPWIFENERIEDTEKAVRIIELCKPYFLALRGDLQGQYHYCLTTVDPMTNREQKVSFIFPGSVEDLWSSLPESETTNPSPMVGGSLGWLAHLTPFEKTLENIQDAKKRLE